MVSVRFGNVIPINIKHGKNTLRLTSFFNILGSQAYSINVRLYVT